MKKTIYILLIISMVLMSSCNKNNIQTVKNEDSDKLAEQFEEKPEDEIVKESSGLVSFGYMDVDKDVYVYDGKEVEIPYYAENMGEEGENDAEVGLMFFVNGELQPYTIVSENDSKTEENTMQIMKLEAKEKKEFKVKFKPISGKKGENIGIIPAIIWNPESIPNESNPRFGNNQHLSANIPVVIKMKKNGQNLLKKAKTEITIEDIPKEILEELETWHGADDYDILDSSVNFQIESSEKNKSIIYGTDGKVSITMKLYGGKQVTDKITVFINNQPVKIDGKDYVQVKTEKGKMCTIKCDIDISQYGELNSLYAIAMTAGEDYKIQDIYKTDSLLLVNKQN